MCAVVQGSFFPDRSWIVRPTRRMPGCVGLAYVVLRRMPLLVCQVCDQPTSGLLHQRLSQRAAVPFGRVNASAQVGRASGAFGGIGRR